ncbi:MAG TPA: Gfo/Idh/MocA family oxidoreductase [Candidatus Avipropionibacterium avicola]|uniref:Gfo/Idh/MocA family oxidoreductase n=1 Tax=Candidatus Avipropionibacterium avicola TaxID=2840701 RepID=A0A9D1GZJ4_9ACTN|nr:Gfo/Idh/MocA family oxidoreductase [Candidatus Avipropionibacterium avicola]
MFKVGFIGFGARAGLWRHAHDPEAGTAVTAVCDISERGRADAAKALPDALVTDDVDQVLDAVDCVFIVTSDDQHAGPAVRALEAGVPVFCEKPMAITIADCDAMLTAAHQNRTRLYIGHNMRHMPVVRQMRDLIADGAIGEVQAVWCRHFVGHGGDYYFKDWHADRSRSTSLLLQKGAHDIDVIHWLAGGYSRTVSAMGELKVYGSITDRRDRSGERMGDWFSTDNWPPRSLTGLNPVVDVEDISMMTMRLDNGVLASYQQCHFTPDYWRNYTVIGDQGRLENDGNGSGTIGVWNKRSRGRGEPDLEVAIATAEGGHGGADPRLVAEFLRFAREGGPTETSPIAARMSVAAGCAATSSLRGEVGPEGTPVTIPELDPALLDWFAADQPS